MRPKDPSLLDFLTVLFEPGQLVRSKTTGMEMIIVGLWEPGAYVIEYVDGMWAGSDEAIVHDAFDLELVN